VAEMLGQWRGMRGSLSMSQGQLVSYWGTPRSFHLPAALSPLPHKAKAKGMNY
jgi:hypothetical protein